MMVWSVEAASKFIWKKSKVNVKKAYPELKPGKLFLLLKLSHADRKMQISFFGVTVHDHIHFIGRFIIKVHDR